MSIGSRESALMSVRPDTYQPLIWFVLMIVLGPARRGAYQVDRFAGHVECHVERIGHPDNHHDVAHVILGDRREDELVLVARAQRGVRVCRVQVERIAGSEDAGPSSARRTPAGLW